MENPCNSPFVSIHRCFEPDVTRKDQNGEFGFMFKVRKKVLEVITIAIGNLVHAGQQEVTQNSRILNFSDP